MRGFASRVWVRYTSGKLNCSNLEIFEWDIGCKLSYCSTHEIYTEEKKMNKQIYK